MQSREDRISLEIFLKRSWPALLFGVVLCIGVSVLLIDFVMDGRFRAPASIPVTTAQEVPVEENRRLLDGVAVDGHTNGTVFAAMIDNAPEAWPLLGPARANLVIEAPVEGGITRLMAVFDGDTTPDTIGPVRSARPYFVEWADGLDAVYAHVGGSPAALRLIDRMDGFRDLDEFGHPLRFSRSSKRAMPHNAFTSGEELRLFSGIREWQTSDFESWSYDDHADETSVAVEDAEDVRISYGGPWNVRWKYDAASQTYLRSQGTSVQKDADGTEVRAVNVVVIRTDADVVDDVGRLDLRTTGSGEAAVFRNGTRVDGRWSREDGAWIRVVDEDGNPIMFSPGTTWISVVTDPKMMP